MNRELFKLLPEAIDQLSLMAIAQEIGLVSCGKPTAALIEYKKDGKLDSIVKLFYDNDPCKNWRNPIDTNQKAILIEEVTNTTEPYCKLMIAIGLATDHRPISFTNGSSAVVLQLSQIGRAFIRKLDTHHHTLVGQTLTYSPTTFNANNSQIYSNSAVGNQIDSPLATNKLIITPQNDYK